MLTYGQGTGSGIDAIGGASSGPGVKAQAGGPSGTGIVALGPGAASVSAPGAGLLAVGGAVTGPGILAKGYNGIWALGGGASTPPIYNGTGLVAVGSNGGTAVFASAGPSPSAPSISGFGVVAVGSNYAYVGPTPGLYAEGARGAGAIRLLPDTSIGPPQGTNQQGEIWLDQAGTVWVCTVSGSTTTPPKWAPLAQGGLNNAVFTAVSTQQYTLINSDGVTWTDLDATALKLTITPSFNCQAILSGNSDLWTSVAGFNQDLGISIAGGTYPSTVGQPEAWKESGGFAGTFLPNAAFVQTIVPLVAGTTYTIKLQWKANKAGASTIWAGAGPIATKFSPTRLSALLIVSQ
jgi:hypothetical protein